MRRYLTIIALAAIFLFGVVAYGVYREPTATLAETQGLRTIQLKGQTIRVSVTDTGASRERGLSGRRALAQDEGMLFVFPKDGKYAFWMKDMHFPIDILWLAADGGVVYMAQNVSPDSFPRTFRPDVLARYVLELPAGYAKEYNITIGDRATF